MLVLVQQNPNEGVVPSRLVDLIWHSHILDTEQYKHDSLRMFGRHLHHAPSFGHAEEKEALLLQQQRMFSAYKLSFGESAPTAVWGDGSQGEDKGSARTHDGYVGTRGLLPDCCSAECVKPKCTGCVGCNAVDCGYKAEGLAEGGPTNKLRRALAPEQFAGYVPTVHPLDDTTLSNQVSYLCSATPFPSGRFKHSMSFEWTISNGYIYFQHTNEGENWYGVGLNSSPMMGLADYMISVHSRNYTGVYDLYKYDVGDGYPCW
jgi:hypothetical protein